MLGRKIVTVTGLLLVVASLAACGTDEGVSGTEQAQIEQVVQNHLTRGAGPPAYDVTIDGVADNRVRVRATEHRVESEPLMLYVTRAGQVEVTPTAVSGVPPGTNASRPRDAGGGDSLGTVVPQEELQALPEAQAQHPGVEQAVPQTGGETHTGDAGAPPGLVTPQAEELTGWVVALGPRLEFTEAELKRAGVPQALRP